MLCPACGCDKQLVIKTRRASDADERLVECDQCGAKWYTETKRGDLYVLNPNTLKRERVPITQIETYRDYILGRSTHPTKPYRE